MTAAISTGLPRLSLTLSVSLLKLRARSDNFVEVPGLEPLEAARLGGLTVGAPRRAAMPRVRA